MKVLGHFQRTILVHEEISFAFNRLCRLAFLPGMDTDKVEMPVRLAGIHNNLLVFAVPDDELASLVAKSRVMASSKAARRGTRKRKAIFPDGFDPVSRQSSFDRVTD